MVLCFAGEIEYKFTKMNLYRKKIHLNGLNHQRCFVFNVTKGKYY